MNSLNPILVRHIFTRADKERYYKLEHVPFLFSDSNYKEKLVHLNLEITSEHRDYIVKLSNGKVGCQGIYFTIYKNWKRGYIEEKLNSLINRMILCDHCKVPNFPNKLVGNYCPDCISQCINTIKSQSVCTICFEKVENDPTQLECGHLFHLNCIDGLNKCPTCRQPF